MRVLSTTWILAAALAAGAAVPQELFAQGRGGQRGRGGQPPRDTRVAPVGTGVIAGRVLAADTSRPIKRARVIVAGGGRPRTTTTDEQGRFRVSELPAATYNITATKTGFVDGIFGQRRALRAGSPIELAEGQQVGNADIRLARGGVITGHVFDEDGEPLARAVVTVLRSQYVRGEKQLAPVSSDQSDDRGQFRVFGLPPGDYFVSAVAGGLDRMVAQAERFRAEATETPGAESTGYAPTYYPGVTTATSAARLKLATAQELSGIDFPLQVVALATVRGVVAGGPAMVMLVTEGGSAPGGGRGGLAGAVAQNYRTSTQADGSFAIQYVTPGSYNVIARADAGTGMPKMAVQPVVVSGDEVTVALAPVAGMDITGTVTLEATSEQVPRALTGFRVSANPLDAAAIPGRAGRPGETSETGQFAIASVFPGRYVIRANGPRGWTMKSVYVDGRDVTDEPIEVKGQALTGVNVIFTDRSSSLDGTVRDSRGAGLEGMTVIAFPVDEARWLPQSRRIVTARTGKTGAYRVNALPAGDYLVAAVEDVEPGEWFDPAFLEQIKGDAEKVTIADGDRKTQDLKASAAPRAPGALF